MPKTIIRKTLSAPARMLELLRAHPEKTESAGDKSQTPLPFIDVHQLECRILYSASPLPVELQEYSEVLDATAIESTFVDFEALFDVDFSLPGPNFELTSDWDSAALIENPVSAFAIGSVPIEPTLEIIFVDESVDDYEVFVADILSQEDAGRTFQVVVLNSDNDGVSQISDALRQFEDVDAIHLVSHGSAGQLKLGNSWLNNQTIAEYSAEIGSWDAALKSGADLLIYGCDLASSADGQDLLNELGALCDCDVAASVDLTGTASLGGDWDLEFTSGLIQTEIVISAMAQQEWVGTLAVITVDTFLDDISDGGDTSSITNLIMTPGSNGISLREAIIAANVNADADTIDLATIGAGTFMITRTGAGEDVAASGDFDLIRNVTIIGAGAGDTFIDAGGLDRIFDVRSGTVTIQDLTIQDGNASGIKVNSGATANLINVDVRGNSGGDGGGIHSLGALTLTDVTVEGNNATWGGGIYLDGVSASFERVTVSGNMSSNNGGGIYNFSTSGVSLTNVTISGNESTGNSGGGLWTNTAMTATNVTIAHNLSSSGGAGINVVGAGDVTLTNSILYNPSGLNSNNTLSSGGFNIDSDGSAGLANGSDLVADPLLDPTLKDNGGATQTHALLMGSAAIDPAGLTGAPAMDQRGFLRDSLPDIGAFESRTAIDLDADDSSGQSGADFQTNYADGGGPVLIADVDATVTDFNSTFLSSLIVTITDRLDGGNEVLAADATGTGIAIGYAGGVLTLTGSGTDTPANFQQVLRTITYNNLSGLASGTSRTITFLANDGSNDSNTATTTFAINAPPTAISPGQVNVNENINTAGGYSVGTLSTTDVDAGETFNYIIQGGADELKFSIGGVGDDELILTDGVLDYDRQPSYTVIVRVTDSVGNPYDETITINVIDYNEIWFSTIGSGAAGGEIWDDTDVVQFGGPGMTLEPTAGTGGTLQLPGFTATDDIRGMHMVRTNLTVGGTPLLAGDLLFTIDTKGLLNDERVFSGFTVDRHDILLFRPDSQGDYSSGTTSIFLDEAFHDNVGTYYNVHAFSLIEQQVTVGSTLLNVGDFVYARSTPSNHDDIYTMSVSSTGFLSTVTTDEQLLLRGSGGPTDTGFDDFQVQGLSVLDRDLNIGDTFLSAGTILVALNTSGTEVVADNNLSIQGEDIFYLSVTQSEPTATIANATLLVEGADLGLNSVTNEENINGLTLVGDLLAGSNVAPTLTLLASPIDATNEEVEVEVSFAELVAAGNENDVDGTVDAFVVKSISSGTLKIGTNAGSATVWIAGTNDTIDASNFAYWTPDLNATGTQNAFAVVAKDNGGSESASSVMAQVNVIPVNDSLPVADAESFTVAEDGTATEADLDAGTSLLDGDTDPDLPNDTLTVNTTPVVDVTYGTLTLNSDGTFNYEHDGSENYSDSFTYEVSDAVGNTDTATVTITITPENDNSPIADGESFSVQEGGTATESDLDAGTSLLDGDTDLDLPNDLLTVDTSPDSDPSFGSLTLNANGTFTYVHDGSENLSDSFTYEVYDADGNTDSATVMITITPANDNLPVADTESFSVLQGGTATETNLDSGNSLLDGDTDPDLPNDTLTVNTTPVSGPSFGSLTLNANGTFSYTHDGSANFSDSFTYQVVDAVGNTDTATVTITISNGNPPIADPESFTVWEGGTATQANLDVGVSLLDGDTDLDLPADMLTVNTTPVSGPSNGLLTLYANGTFSYTHDGSENFVDSFVYEVSDVLGNTDTAVVTITVTPVNDNTPVVDAESFTVIEGGTATEANLDAGTSLLDGDTDVDLPNDTLTVNTTPVSGPSFGILTLNPDGTFSYVHDGSENFTDSFTYLVTDAAGNSTLSSTTITITPVDESPIAVNDNYIAFSNEVFVAASGVLANDYDPEGNALSISLISATGNGTVTLAADGSFIYVPNQGFTGTDIFVYQIDDGSSTPSLATVTLNVIGVGNQVVDRDQPAEEPTQNEEENQDDESEGEEIEAVPPAANRSVPDSVSADSNNVGNSVNVEADVEQFKILTNDRTPERDSALLALGDFTSRTVASAISNNLAGSSLRQHYVAKAFIGVLDELRGEVDDSRLMTTAFLGSSIAVSSTLSVGYVLWLIRGGVLLSSVMSSLPAWRMVDPLPVLGYLDDDDETDDESLETLVTKSNSANLTAVQS